MSLLIDGNVAQLTDLSEYESSISDVATAEGIDLFAKLSVARLEVTLAIQKFLLDSIETGFGINNIVVTEGLRQWHILQTLSVFYRDAYSQQLNDRYKAKWKEYGQLAVDASAVYFAIGVGIALSPIPKPQLARLAQTVGSQQAMTWFVRTSWVSTRSVESAPSLVNAFTTQEGSALTVTCTSPPREVNNWNVYVGLAADAMVRQNLTPIPIHQTWVMPAGLIADGEQPTGGQGPDTYVKKRNVFRRG
jgi:hypothetical protein